MIYYKPGQQIGTYLLIEKVGAGGFGEVWRASDLTGKPDFALKLILPQNIHDREFQRRFEEEARLVKSLNNPDIPIVPVYDFGREADGTLFIVMKWLGGGSLRHRIRTLSLNDIQQLVDRLTAALDYTHRKGIVHRDLKPENILYDDQGNAFLGDFGIAKDLLRTTPITTSEAPVTPAYASPEQMMQVHEPLSSLSDIYSLGLMLFECLNREYPFSNHVAHLYSPLPLLHALQPQYSPELDAVLRKATAPEPLNRYPDVHAFEAAFLLALQSPGLLPGIPNIERMDTTVVIRSDRPISEATAAPSIPLEETRTDQLQVEDFIFVSHSSKDDALTDRIYARLKAAKISAWIDHRSLKPGTNWDQAIQTRLNQCQGCFLILTRHSAASQECLAEWRTILSYGRPLYVVLADSIPDQDIPYRLRPQQWVDIQGDHFDPGMDRIIRQINDDLKGSESGSGKTGSENVSRLSPSSPAVRPATGTGRNAILVREAGELPVRSPVAFYGRDQELAKIGELLTQNLRVLLQGFGGMGKSTLAAKAVENRFKQSGSPLLWFEVGNSESSVILDALIRALVSPRSKQYKEFATLAPAEKTLRLNNWLHKKQVGLIVLDNLWCEDGELEAVLKMLPAQVPVLATSRNRYTSPDLKILDIDKLDAAAALALLSYHANHVYTGQTRQKAVALCELLGNHPFALEIAGRNLSVDDLTPGELLAEIAPRPHEIALPDVFEQEKRQPLKLLIDTSFEKLPTTAREVFLTFGVLFTAGATAELLALCLRQPLDNVKSALRLLARRGLAKRQFVDANSDASLYQIHDLAFSYTRTRSYLKRLDAVIACQNYTVRYRQEFGAIDLERTNLFEAAQSAYQSGDAKILIEMVSALALPNPPDNLEEQAYFETRGYGPATIQLLEHAVEATSETGETELRHYLLGKLGDARAEYGEDISGALEALEAALKLAREMGNRHREALLMIVLATRNSKVHPEKIETLYQDAYRIAAEIHDDYVLSRFYEHRGNQAYWREDYETAQEDYTRALEKAESAGISELEFYAALNLGEVEYRLKNFRKARRLSGRAHRLGCRKNNLRWLAGSAHSLGELYATTGRREFARKCFDEALELYLKTEDLPSLKMLIETMQEFDPPFAIASVYLRAIQE